MMKKPLCFLLLIGALFIPHQNAAQVFRPSKPQEGLKKESEKEYRKRLRLPYRQGITNRVPKLAWEHAPIKIHYGTDEFKSTVNKMLNRLKKEEPLLYKVALHRVESVQWVSGRGSFAIPRRVSRGTIYMGERDWNHSRNWFFLTLIHEIQHCNSFGDPSEGAARWSGVYYGTRLKLHPYLINYLRATSFGCPYKEEWWADNLKNTRLNYEKQLKSDYNTDKYYVDHAGLTKKYAQWYKNNK